VVGIAVLTLVPGRLGGSETYVRELLRGLARTGSLAYRVVVPPVAPDEGGGLPAVVAHGYRPARTIPERLLAMAAAAARPRPLRALLADADVVHYPLTIRIPTGLRPAVVTLHDVQHLDLPRLFPRAERLFRMAAWGPSLRGAARIVVPSAFVRDRAVAAGRLDAARVRVVPSGVDHARFRPAAVEREPFLLYPARAWPHKNHRRLLEAFALLRRERPELRLVLTGGGALPTLPAGAEARGRVEDEELVDLYRRAAALVFPSLYEGFGQPPLEAMACGCPVACSRAGALPEVVGEAARLFDPDDARAIAAAVRDVLDAPAEWSRRGLERAAGYSWDATARATEAVYRELL
jgi:glycosyltransferase involved in cell wall biosynthesis